MSIFIKEKTQTAVLCVSHAGLQLPMATLPLDIFYSAFYSGQLPGSLVKPRIYFSNLLKVRHRRLQGELGSPLLLQLPVGSVGTHGGDGVCIGHNPCRQVVLHGHGDHLHGLRPHGGEPSVHSFQEGEGGLDPPVGPTQDIILGQGEVVHQPVILKYIT